LKRRHHRYWPDRLYLAILRFPPTFWMRMSASFEELLARFEAAR
jgi:hypothetical protein